MNRDAGRRILLGCGNFFFKYRNAVFPIVLLTLLALSPPRPLGNWSTDRLVDALGIAIVLFGHAVRALVIGLAYIRRGGKDGKVHADDLVVEGVFAHSRNPLYLGNLLVLAGIMIVANSLLLTFVGAPFFAFAYGSIVFAEEDYLGRKFGKAYKEYMRSVPRFLPRNLDVLRTMRSMTFDWRRVLRKEYGSLFVSATILLAIFSWETWIRGGAAALRSIEPKLIALGIAVVCFYGTVRVLKKSRRLRATGGVRIPE
jgi:protein-S-isoprenylcysteine O-methyltransferase Ste14